MPTTCAVRTAVRSDVPVAASTAVVPLLRTPARGTVLARFPAAVYVRLDDGAVLAVVTSDGLRLPNALVVAAPSRDAPFARRPTGAAVLDGALEVDGVRYRPCGPGRRARRRTGVLRPAAVVELAARLAGPPHTGAVGARLSAATARLGAALRTGDGLVEAADALLGLGPGLTPAGDDVLAGALVTSAHLGPGLPALVAHVHRRADATTALSADLLRHACAGRAAPPVLDLLDALVGARPGRTGARGPAGRRLDVRPRHRHRRPARRPGPARPAGGP
jgi:hypothetical protein